MSVRRCSKCRLTDNYCECESTSFNEVAVPFCPGCNDDVSVFCEECGNDYLGCDCLDEPNLWFCMKCYKDFSIYDPKEDPSWGRSAVQEPDGRWYWDDGTEAKCYCHVPKLYVCGTCDVSRPTLTAFWNPWVEMDANEERSSLLESDYAGMWGKCDHFAVKVVLKEVTVYASSLNDKRIIAIPDFGLYADWSWQPWWRQEHIDWRDFGLPTDYDVAYDQIVDAYKRAKNGEMVEVGCIGGHGRTGTILACMAVLDGMIPKDAIKHIEDTYCSLIIETMDQEWYVSWFEAKMKGVRSPKKIAPAPVSTACTISDHFAMVKSGLAVCKFASCKTYELDKDRYLRLPEPSKASVGKVKIPKSIKEIAEELRMQLMLPNPPAPAGGYPTDGFQLGDIHNGYVMTADGWTALHNEEDLLPATGHTKTKRGKRGSRR